MTAPIALPRAPYGDAWSIAGRALLLVAVAALVYLAVRLSLASYELPAAQWRQRLGPLLLAAFIYLCGHGLRILRLALLIGGWRVGFRDIASFHFMTAAVSLAIPLKLGEAYRAIELANIAGGIVRAFIIVLFTRVLDTVVILLMLLVALTHVSGAVTQFGGIAAMAAAFIGIAAIVFFVVPENLRRLSVFIIRRYDSPRTVRLLRALDSLRRALKEAPNMMREKVGSLATLTLLIWICEVACFAIAIPALGGSLNAALDALLNFLSAVTQGQTLLGFLAPEHGGTADSQLLTYLTATQIPLVIIGLLASVRYIRFRFRS